MARTFAIRNFERWQHYSDRKPPWIKLHRDLWRDRKFFRLSDRAKLLFIGLTTIASLCDNRIPEDPEWVAVELGFSPKSVDFEALVQSELIEVVEQDDSTVLAERLQSATCSPSLSVSLSSLSDPEWKEEDLWLRKFLERQATFNGMHLPYLMDLPWWNQVSDALNGLNEQILEPEFAKMGAWIRENPARAPTAKGVRRFVRSWLERAVNDRRKYAAAKTYQR